MRIFQKLITANFFILTMFGVATFLTVQVTIHAYNEKMYQKTVQVLGEFTTGVANDLKSVEQYSLNTAMNLQIQNQLVKIRNYPDDYDEFQSANMLENQLLLQSISTDFLTTVCYIDTHGKSFTLGANSEPIQESTIQQLCIAADQAHGGYVSQAPSLKSAYIYSAREILEYTDASLQPLGTLVFASDLNAIIRENYHNIPYDKGALCIYDGRNLIYESDLSIKLTNKRFSSHTQGYYMTSIQGKSYFVAYIRSSDTNWTYVSILPYSSMFRNILFLQNVLVIVLLSLFAVSLLLNFWISRNITRPLEDLTASMRLAETGNFRNLQKDLFDYDRADEVGCLQKDFLKMFRRINSLIDENYHKQMMIQETKYRALQSQIEPHFLYNTLSSINWLAIAGKNKEVSQMVIALSGFLRTTVNQKPSVLLAEEVQLLENYIQIQEIRYEGRVSFSIRIPDAHRACIVPCLLLQPIVENSIKYGVENMLGVCTIAIYSEDAGDGIRIIVQDNGPGMDPGQLARLQAFEVRPSGSGIGLRNIDERLQILFGEAYRLKIESEPGKGTRVIIPIPRKAGAGNVEDPVGR